VHQVGFIYKTEYYCMMCNLHKMGRLKF